MSAATADVSGRRLLNARLLRSSKVFAREQRWRSWWHFWSTILIFLALVCLACPDRFSLLIRIPASILAGLVLVRCFIL